MKRLLRWLVLLLLGWIGTNYVEVKRYRQIMLWLPKLFAGGLAPVLGAASGVLGLVGLCRCDVVTAAAGALGAALAAQYTRQLVAPHEGFAAAFGSDWQSRITSTQRARMLRERYVGVLPTAPEPRWTQDLVFWTLSGAGPDGGDRALLCDLWQPPAHVTPSGLGLVYLHGSGWHWMDKDAGTRPFFRHLAAQGHVIVDVAYRLSPETDMAGMVGDAKRAVAWLKAHAAEYGVDPGRVVISGGSAGGHLALLAAYTPNHPALDPPDLAGVDTSVCGVISYYGPADLTLFYRWLDTLAPSSESPLERAMDARFQEAFHAIFGEDFDLGELTAMLTQPLGGSPDEVPEAYALFSPLTHVGPGNPPTLLLQGAHDLGVRPAIARTLRDALRQAGVPVVYVEYPRADHGFDLFVP
ncbi:MAG: alpha/beta hydrolase, partial [Anaerolineae bacterium]|nr:alpha/beta hydrolase [Anaerolineae bacterium]